MASSLQEALLKAGMVTQKKIEQAAAAKKSFSRPPPRKKGSAPRRRPPPVRQAPGFIEHKNIQHIRTDCEACKKSAPDVEYYEHTNKRLSVKWLCVNCADNNNIMDDCRQTMQSEQSMRKVFTRRYGKTKIFK
jgi:hypothetical protein